MPCGPDRCSLDRLPNEVVRQILSLLPELDALNAASAGVIFFLNSAKLGFIINGIPRVHHGRSSPLKQRSRAEECHRHRVIHWMLTKSAADRIQALTVLQRREVRPQDDGSIEQVVGILTDLSQSSCGVQQLCLDVTLSLKFPLSRFKSLKSLSVSTRALADLSDLNRLQSLTLWDVERYINGPGKPLLPRLEALEKLTLHFAPAALPTSPIIEQFIDLEQLPNLKKMHLINRYCYASPQIFWRRITTVDQLILDGCFEFLGIQDLLSLCQRFCSAEGDTGLSSISMRHVRMRPSSIMQRASTPVGLRTLRSVELEEVDPGCFHGCRLTLRQFRLHFYGPLFADHALSETLSASIDTNNMQVLCLSSSTRLTASHGFFHHLRISSNLAWFHTAAPRTAAGDGLWSKTLRLWACGPKRWRQLRTRRGVLAACLKSDATSSGLAAGSFSSRSFCRDVDRDHYFAFVWGDETQRFLAGPAANEFLACQENDKRGCLYTPYAS